MTATPKARNHGARGGCVLLDVLRRNRLPHRGAHGRVPEEVMAVDHVQRLIYVSDLSDPFAVLALSIEDGSLRGTYGAGEGDGPGELRRPPAAGGRPGRRHGVGWWVRESLDRRWRPGFDVAAL